MVNTFVKLKVSAKNAKSISIEEMKSLLVKDSSLTLSHNTKNLRGNFTIISASAEMT